MKKKRVASTFNGIRRRSARLLQSKAQKDPQPSSSKPSSQSVNLFRNQYSSSLKRLKGTENVSISELEKSGNESIPTLKNRSWVQESDQNSSSNTSAELHATISHFIRSGLSPALADSPTAPSRYVQSHKIVGDKTKECNNTRPAGASIETISSSESTFDVENFNSKHQGKRESEPHALHSVTAEEIGGVAVATIASKSGSDKQVALGETRVISDVAKETPNDVNNFMTSDEPPRRTYSIGLSEMAYLFADDDSNQDVVQSFFFDPSLVSVQGYRVKEATAPILRNVMEKHGDIAMNCIVETLESRSFFLEKMCEIIQTLQTTKFVDITETEVNRMLVLVADLGRVNLDVGWLQERLEEILEAIELIKRSSEFKESRKRNAQIIQESERALKRYETVILEHEAKIQALKEKAKLEKMKMDAAQADDRGIVQRFSKLKPRVNRFIKECLLHDLQ